VRRVDQPERRPRSRYERAVERRRQRDRRDDRAWMEQYLSEPFGSFLAEQLAWGAVGLALGLVLGSWTWAVTNAVVLAGVGLVGRAWVRRRYRRDTGDRSLPPGWVRTASCRCGAVPGCRRPQLHGHPPGSGGRGAPDPSEATGR
jgi:hypothetical protein